LGSDQHIYWINWDGSQWSGWTVVPGPQTFGTGPAVASRGANFLDLFARGGADTLETNVWNGTSWQGWRQVSPVLILSDPAAVARGANRMDVFATQSGDTMNQIPWTGSWAPSWTTIPAGQLSSGAAVVDVGRLASDRMDVFARGMDNTLYTSVSSGGTWPSGWPQVSPETIASKPAAVSLRLTETELFVRRDDNRMYTLVWAGSRVPSWTPLGDEKFSGGPAAVSAGGAVHLFARGRARAERWVHVRSGRIDDASSHNAVNFRNAYNTVLSGLLASTVTRLFIYGIPNCEETQVQTMDLPRATIGLAP
jgi:hypothetical protein